MEEKIGKRVNVERTDEALDLLKAWGTGHPGGIGTIHAGSALGALRRLEQLIQEAVVTVPRALIAETIDRLQGLFHQRAVQGDDATSEPENLYGAVHAMFRLSRDDLDRAERTLRRLAGRAPSARAYAWLAFLLTFKVGQRFSDQASTSEEA